MNFLDQLTTQLYNIIWAIPLIVLALGTGLYFSLRMRFPQLRLIKGHGQVPFWARIRRRERRPAARECRPSELRAGSRRPRRRGKHRRCGYSHLLRRPGRHLLDVDHRVYRRRHGFRGKLSGAGVQAEDRRRVQRRTCLHREGTGVKVFALIFAFAAVLANGITGPTIQAFNFAEAAHNAFGLNPGSPALSWQCASRWSLSAAARGWAAF